MRTFVGICRHDQRHDHTLLLVLFFLRDTSAFTLLPLLAVARQDDSEKDLKGFQSDEVEEQRQRRGEEDEHEEVPEILGLYLHARLTIAPRNAVDGCEGVQKGRKHVKSQTSS